MVPIGSVAREAVALCACSLRVNGDVAIDTITRGERTPATDLVHCCMCNTLACCGSACPCWLGTRIGGELPRSRTGCSNPMGPGGRGQARQSGLRVCSTTILAWLSACLLLLLLLMRCSRSSQLLPYARNGGPNPMEPVVRGQALQAGGGRLPPLLLTNLSLSLIFAITTLAA